MRNARALAVVMLLDTGVAAALLACSDDEDVPRVTSIDATCDADTPLQDAQPGVEAGATDSAGDTDAFPADVSAPVQTSVGSTGYIRLWPDTVRADFRDDDTIVRLASAPECVLHVGSLSKAPTPMARLVVGGPVVGTDGGPSAPIEVLPNDERVSLYNGPVFPVGEALLVQLEADGTPPTFPPIPLQSFRTSPAELVEVTTPTLSDSGDVIIDSTKALDVIWKVPAGAPADLRMAVSLTGIFGGTQVAGLYCGYPISAGKAVIPLALMAELRARVGPGELYGGIQVVAGGQLEFVSGSASYVIEVTSYQSTTLPPSSILFR